MPNHVTNKVKFIGIANQINELVNNLSTFHEKKPHFSYSGESTYEKKDEKNSFGWLDEKTGIFRRRGHDDVIGVPADYTRHFDPEWTAMPDFNKIIPQPKNIFKGNLGKDEKEMCIKEGRPTWYDWNLDNWGTKWGGYNYEKLENNEFLFQTAWNSVPKLINKISHMFPNIEIDYKYADEDTGYNTGHYKFKGGKEIYKNIPEGGSKEAYELVFQISPSEKEHFKLIDGEYQYKED